MAAVVAVVTAGREDRSADPCSLHPGKGTAEKPQDTTVVVSNRVLLLKKPQDTAVVVSNNHVTGKKQDTAVLASDSHVTETPKTPQLW